jgi:large subunit ribosomal protein L23
MDPKKTNRHRRVNQWNLIHKVLFTEKSYEGQDDEGKRPSVYYFQVDMLATKPELKKAVTEAFGLAPQDILSVRTLIRPGKFKRRGRNRGGYTPDRKKAVVTLRPGKTIAALSRG